MEIKGVDVLKQVLIDKQKLEVLKKTIHVNGQEMQRKMVQNTKYFTGYTDSSGKFKRPTGATKRSITGQQSNFGMTYKAGPKTHYSLYVNFGTRYMSPRPFVTDAFNAQKEIFKRDLDRLVK